MSQTLAPVGNVYSIRGYGDWLILFESTLWKWRNAIMFSSVSDITLQLFIFVLFTLFTAATGAMLWCNCFKLASGFMVLINHLSSFCLCALWETLRGALSTCLGEPAPPSTRTNGSPCHLHAVTAAPRSQVGQRWERKS